jgi:hypothetical protein
MIPLVFGEAELLGGGGGGGGGGTGGGGGSCTEGGDSNLPSRRPMQSSPKEPGRKIKVLGQYNLMFKIIVMEPHNKVIASLPHRKVNVKPPNHLIMIIARFEIIFPSLAS